MILIKLLLEIGNVIKKYFYAEIILIYYIFNKKQSVKTKKNNILRKIFIPFPLSLENIKKGSTPPTARKLLSGM